MTPPIMPKTVILQKKTQNGDLLQAEFSPNHGMNLLSLKKNNLEVIDQSTLPLFQERSAGLGALIGPHFHHRAPSLIPALHLSKEDFPHLIYVEKKQIKEPFSHGIGRYAPWNYVASPSHIKASLLGETLWKNHPLKTLEWFDFLMSYEAFLTETGLHINLDVKGEKPSLMGLHTYYNVGKTGTLSAKVEKVINLKGEFKPLPPHLMDPSRSYLHFLVDDEIDAGFIPFGKTSGMLVYETADHAIKISMKSANEISFQVYHPKGSSFVCIEPLSTKNPRDLNLKSSSISIDIDII